MIIGGKATENVDFNQNMSRLEQKMLKKTEKYMITSSTCKLLYSQQYMFVFNIKEDSYYRRQYFMCKMETKKGEICGK